MMHIDTIDDYDLKRTITQEKRNPERLTRVKNCLNLLLTSRLLSCTDRSRPILKNCYSSMQSFGRKKFHTLQTFICRSDSRCDDVFLTSTPLGLEHLLLLERVIPAVLLLVPSHLVAIPALVQVAASSLVLLLCSRGAPRFLEFCLSFQSKLFNEQAAT